MATCCIAGGREHELLCFISCSPSAGRECKTSSAIQDKYQHNASPSSESGGQEELESHPGLGTARKVVGLPIDQSYFGWKPSQTLLLIPMDSTGVLFLNVSQCGQFEVSRCEDKMLNVTKRVREQNTADIRVSAEADSFLLPTPVTRPTHPVLLLPLCA